MKLDACCGGDPALAHMERYVNEGTQTYSPFAARTEVAPQFQPRSDLPSFELVTVHAPEESVSVFQAEPAKSLQEFFLHPDGLIFAVHPETWGGLGVENLDKLQTLPRGKPIPVTPTASTRTVLALEHAGDVPPHFIKLHYPHRISRFNRRLRRVNIQNSVALTREIGQVQSEKFAYLPDTLGFVFGDGHHAWGFLVREGIPRPFQGGRTLVPCFALFGGDLKHPDDPPLLVQMIERLGVDPQSFVIDEIMVPVVECWARVARERGILLESHAQNTLLEIDHDFKPRRIVHRDFDVWIDRDARRRAGLETPFLGAVIGSDTGHALEQHYSLIYDRFLGHEFFDCLLGVLKHFYAVDEDAVRNRVKETFHRAFPESSRYFPPQTMFYFSNEPKPGNEFTLVDMKRPPEWR